MKSVRFIAWHGLRHIARAGLPVLFLCTFSPPALADSVFKCKGADGTFHYQGSKCAQAQEVSSWPTEAANIVKVSASHSAGYNKTGAAAAAFVVVRMDALNAFRLRGSINGTPVGMMVDTGASMVSIPTPLARQLELQCYSKVPISTANGMTQACRSVVHSLQIGQLILPDVDVVVINGLHEVLLGQTALGRLKVEQSKGEIHLSLDD